MADIQRRKTATGETRWDVRYRDTSRQQRKRSFVLKTDAVRFSHVVEADLLRKEWIDPKHGQEPFEPWAQRWARTLEGIKPKTKESYESIIRVHLIPRFGTTPTGAIDYPLAVEFIGDLHRRGLKPPTIRNIRDVLRQIIGFAVKSGALRGNPIRDITVRRAARPEMVFLEPEQIFRLADEVSQPPARYRRDERRVDGSPEYGLLVRFAAFTGLRAGEIVALRVKNIDLRRRTVEVNASVSEAHGELQQVPTKTYERRTVPVPAAILTELLDHTQGRDPDGFIWQSPHGGPFRHTNWYGRHYKPAVLRACLSPRTRFHDLRHSYAALLIAQGAHPRAIMERMGHSTITVTLDTYGHLLPKIDGELDAALNLVYREGLGTAPDVRRRPSGADASGSRSRHTEPHPRPHTPAGQPTH